MKLFARYTLNEILGLIKADLKTKDLLTRSEDFEIQAPDDCPIEYIQVEIKPSD